jgi:hypothetical protein
MEITVPTLERDTAPQTNCGDDTDGSTMTVLPTWTSWEHAADEQAVAPCTEAYVPDGHSMQLDEPLELV